MLLHWAGGEHEPGAVFLCLPSQRSCRRVNGRQDTHVGEDILEWLGGECSTGAFLLIGLPLHRCSLVAKFIPCTPRHERPGILKGKRPLEQLPDDSTDIMEKCVIDYFCMYQPWPARRRPRPMPG